MCGILKNVYFYLIIYLILLTLEKLHTNGYYMYLIQNLIFQLV